MRAGEIVGGRFEIEAEAGAGGMGSVYRARDRLGSRTVAVKVLTRGTEDDVVRFSREAEWLAELTHPGIVQYLAHGQTPEGLHYIAMEWLEGESLAKRLERTPMSPADGVRVVCQVAEPLAVAHQRGVVHRDLKPSNIFLVDRSTEKVKILDFGIARRVSETTGLTGSGRLIGTYRYMSPEQAQGATNIDPRADVFALGCVLFECLTSRKAFPGHEASTVLAKILLEEPPDVRELRPSIPKPLAELVSRMLSKDRNARPEHAMVVATELTKFEALAKDARWSSIPAAPSLTQVERRLGWVLLTGGVTDDTEHTVSERTAGEEDRRKAMQSVVSAHGGQLKLLPDGSAIVTFAGGGAPIDQGLRAARCALALQSVLKNPPMSLTAGVGVVSEPDTAGDALERGVQELHAAERGMIRLDPVAARLLEDQFEVRHDESGVHLRREPDPLDTVRRLLVMGKTTTCVGRTRELATLEAVFDECVSDSVCRAVLITGAPGVGKSRLQYEFLKRLDAREEPIVAFLAHGDSISTVSPFGLLAGAIRRSASILEGASVEERRQKLRARVATAIPEDAATVDHITMFLGEVISATFPDDASEILHAARRDQRLMRDTIRDAFVEWIRCECAIHPVIVVLENLHWGDLQTVQLIDRALAELRDQPLLVVALARPEIRDRFSELWEERDLLEMRLGPISKKASERLVRHVLGDDVPEEQVKRIVERGDGNPFYLEELVRAVADGAERLPDTVLGMAQARLDAVSIEARRVLRAASLYGERFWKGAVAALVGTTVSGAELTKLLEELEREELVVRRKQSAFPEEREYAFRQLLVRDAAYALLTEEDRKLGHRLAAEWLLAQGEPDWNLVAEHYERSGARIASQRPGKADGGAFSPE